MKGLGAEDGGEGAVGQRNLLGPAGEHLRLCRYQGAHGPVGLDRDHLGEALDEQTGQLAGPCAEVEHSRVGSQLELRHNGVDHLRRP
jgi:hypothetical protein